MLADAILKMLGLALVAVSQRLAASLPRKVWVLAAASFLIALGYGLVAPILPALARSFDVGVTAASLVISAFAVLRIAFAPAGSRLITRFGELRVYCTGLGVVALSSAACALAGEYWQLLVFRAAGGVGSTMFTVSTASLIVKLAPPDMRGRATGAWSTAFLLGNIAGPVIGGLLVLVVGPRTPFLVYAGLLVISAIVTGVLLHGRAGGAAPAPETDAVTFRELVRDSSTFRLALASNFVDGWMMYGAGLALIPLFVAEVLKEPAWWAGAALSAFACGTAVTVLISGLASDRFGPRRPIIIGSALVAVSSVGLASSSTAMGVVGAALLSGIGTGLMSTPVNALVADLIARRGQARNGSGALAGFQMVGDLGAVVGPVLCGLIAELFGYCGAFLLTALIAGLLCLNWGRPRPP